MREKTEQSLPGESKDTNMRPKEIIKFRFTEPGSSKIYTSILPLHTQDDVNRELLRQIAGEQLREKYKLPAETILVLKDERYFTQEEISNIGFVAGW